MSKHCTVFLPKRSDEGLDSPVGLLEGWWPPWQSEIHEVWFTHNKPEKGKAGTGPYHAKLLGLFDSELHKKPFIWQRKKFFFHHDKTPVPTTVANTANLDELGYGFLPCPPSSLNKALYDFFVSKLETVSFLDRNSSRMRRLSPPRRPTLQTLKKRRIYTYWVNFQLISVQPNPYKCCKISPQILYILLFERLGSYKAGTTRRRAERGSKKNFAGYIIFM